MITTAIPPLVVDIVYLRQCVYMLKIIEMCLALSKSPFSSKTQHRSTVQETFLT